MCKSKGMVNQDPQPEVFDSEFTFGAATAAGTSITNTIYTLQGQNEEVRIYGFTAQSVDDNGAQTAIYDFNMELIAGANSVPSNPFSIAAVTQSDEKMCAFTVPVVIKFKQPLQVKITPNIATAAGNTNVRIQLIGETGVIKV